MRIRDLLIVLVALAIGVLFVFAENLSGVLILGLLAFGAYLLIRAAVKHGVSAAR